MNANAPWLDAVPAQSKVPEQVFYTATPGAVTIAAAGVNVENVSAAAPVPAAAASRFFDNNPQQVSSAGTPANTFNPAFFNATEGFSDGGVTHTTGGMPVSSATNPQGNSGALAQGQTVPTVSQPDYNPSILG